MLPEGVQGRHTDILDDIDSMAFPGLRCSAREDHLLGCGWLGCGWRGLRCETPHYTVLPWRLVLVRRTPHRRLLLENLTDKSSSTGPIFTPIPCPHYLLWCLHCGLGGQMQPYTQCSTGLWVFGSQVPHNADNCLVH